MSEQKIPIPAMLYNAAVGGHVTNSQQIIDENLNREQNDINQETVGAVLYNSTTPNGMGRIVLKKTDNFKEVVEAQTNGNTIFVIKYDFTLTDNVTIPANCVLQFEGGSISGAHTLTGTNTSIQAELVKIFGTTTTIAGTWKTKEAYPEWFGDDETAVELCYNQLGKVVFTNKYLYHRTINLNKIGSIYFKPGCVVGCNYFTGPSQWLFKVDMSGGPVTEDAGDLNFNTQIVYGSGTVDCGNDCCFLGILSNSTYHRAMLYDLHVIHMQEPTNPDITFTHSYGIYTEVETRVNNCDFYALGPGPEIVCNLEHVDCFICNTKIIGYRTKLKVQGSTFVSSVHCWGWNDNGYEKIAVVTNGNNVIINGLYCDAQDICISTTTECNSVTADNVFVIGAPQLVRSENNRGWGLFGFMNFCGTSPNPAADILYVTNGTNKSIDNDHKIKFNYVLQQHYDQQTITGLNLPVGQCMFDVANNKPIYWTGSAWVDATGATI